MEEITWDQCEYFGFTVDKSGMCTFVPVVGFKDGMPIFDAGTPIQGLLEQLVAEAPNLVAIYKLDDVNDKQLKGDNQNLGQRLKPSTLIMPDNMSEPSIGKVDWKAK